MRCLLIRPLVFILTSLSAFPTFAEKSQTIAIECKSQSAKATWFFTIENDKLSITDNYTSSYNPIIKDSKYVLSDHQLVISWTENTKYFDSNERHDTRYRFKVNRFTQKFSIEIEWSIKDKSMYEGECQLFSEKKF